MGFVERSDKEIGERPSRFETMKYNRDVISMLLFLYETFDTSTKCIYIRTYIVCVYIYYSGIREKNMHACAYKTSRNENSV